MYKFITARCSCCGAVIYNLPETEAEKLKNAELKCEDCKQTHSFDDFDSDKSDTTSLKQVRHFQFNTLPVFFRQL